MWDKQLHAINPRITISRTSNATRTGICHRLCGGSSEQNPWQVPKGLEEEKVPPRLCGTASRVQTRMEPNAAHGLHQHWWENARHELQRHTESVGGPTCPADGSGKLSIQQDGPEEQNHLRSSFSQRCIVRGFFDACSRKACPE
eukprot:3632041-Amphidinium_carterae.1